jgi:hypothetical protein
VVTGGEVQGQGKTQRLTVVLLRYLSSTEMAGERDLDEDSGGGGEEEYRRSSGGRCAGLEGQWMVREASQG